MLKSGLLGATVVATGMLVVANSAFAQAAPNTQNPVQPAPVTTNDRAAQQSADASADGEERGDGTIVVTGTRIPRPETDGVLPGVQVSAQQIESRGFTNALEALNDIPLVGPGASPLNGNNGGQAASLGAAFVDLLDLGTQRTLTLVNGRRFVSGNAASLFVEGNATGAQVDVNVIPAALIQRIDVLTVGGAAAYGSDAIAGVVNYILKDDFEGLQLRGLSGITSRKDAAQYQLSAILGQNFLDDRANITLAAEYDRSDGLQADRRSFRVARTSSYTNPFNGSVRNTAFAPDIIDVVGSNNGAFLRNSDDLQPSSLFDQGFVNQSLSYNGTVLNTLATAPTPYVPITSGTGAALRTSNFISFQNGLATVGFALPGTDAAGRATTVATPNVGFFATTSQIIQGTPGAGYISGNGLNGQATPIAGVPITTFAPTALPGTVTAAQVFTQFGITPPAGLTAPQQSTLAINVLQANRFTAREFFAANPNVAPNAFIGTFVPGVPRVANTDTTLVTVRTNATGGTTQVPVNQVLPFVAVPLEFNTDGSLRPYTLTSGINPRSPLTLGQAQGSDGGFQRSVENIVLRTQQDRYIGNLLAKFDLTPDITLFTEGSYARVRNVSVTNAPSQNFLINSQENAPLLLNVNNPFLTTQARTQLAAVGISAGAANGGNFIVTRQNQDIFDGNPFKNTAETYRIVGGARSKFEIFGKPWNAEISGTYGKATQRTQTTQINDIEYQLALDAVLDPGTNRIRCRAQLFPGQYLGRTPVGTSANITRLPGADGIPTEVIVTPTITQSMIDSCQPLNPFGYNNMSAEAKAYVRQDVEFKNVSQQTFLQAQFGGEIFDLPAGPIGVSVAGEYRKEKQAFTTDLLNILGRGRSAPSSNTRASTETYEIGAEARIPITGDDFLPFLGTLEFSPAVRVSQQDGRSQTYRSLAGQLISPKAQGDVATIYSLAGIWRPIRDIQFRANVTRSVRQPSIVELFLGGQPSFSTPTDFCSPANIDQGLQAANRRANCRADVIAKGLAPDNNRADTFLATFVPNGVGLQGTFTGAPSLSPEKGKSWTAGGVLTPRWLPGLTLSADYIHLNLKDIIIPTSLAQSIQFCYDSPTYPDTSAQTGSNTCGFFSRDAQFQVANGYGLGFLNLSSTKLRALNFSGSYPVELGNIGKVTVRANAYHLIKYQTSAAGDFTDALESAGSFARPKWETQLSGRYEKDGFYSQVTWNWKSSTKIFSSGLPATGELFPFVKYPDLSQVDIVIGADINDSFRLQFNVINVTDTTTAGNLGFIFQDYYDQVGRRFQVAATAKF